MNQLPWPAGWAPSTRGPQYRPAIVSGVVCTLLAATLAFNNLADGFLITVFAVGLFIWALRPADAQPIRVGIRQVRARGVDERGVQFPLRAVRIGNPLGLLRRRPSVTLTPTAVIADNGATLVIPWSAITEIRATGAVTGVEHSILRPPRLNWLTIGVADRTAVPGASPRLATRFGPNTVAGFATTTLLSNALVLYHALHYYLDNPQARAELADDGGLHRIRGARVDPYDA